MTRWACAITACTLLASPVAGAAAGSGTMAWGGSVTLASDHLLRGVSRSSNDPSVSAEIHVQDRRGWFGGLWAASSRVRPEEASTVELAASVGFHGTLGDAWSWRGSYTHYESPWQRLAAQLRYNEATLDLQFRDVLLLSASWSPDTRAYGTYQYPAHGHDAFAYEASVQQALPADFSAQAGVGYHDLVGQPLRGYWYGSIGLGRTWQRWRASVSYVRAGAAARHMSWPGAAGGRALFQLSYVIPDT